MIRPAHPYLKRTLPAAFTGRLARGRAKLRAAARADTSVELPADLLARLEDHFAPDREWLVREAGITFPARTR
jgi:hypothetical protein